MADRSQVQRIFVSPSPDEDPFNLYQPAQPLLKLTLIALSFPRMNAEKDACRTKCDIAFRVECQDEWHNNYNLSYDAGNLIPRAQNAISQQWLQRHWLQAVDDHLSWTPTDTPFISFTTSWKSALRRRKWLINDRGAEEVIVYAVSLKGMQNVYSAYEAASLCGYRENSEDRRRKLAYHQSEVLVEGSIPATENRILALFLGNEIAEENVSLRLEPNVQPIVAKIPYGSLFVAGDASQTEQLKQEVLNNTGTNDADTFRALVLALCGRPTTSGDLDELLQLLSIE